MYFLRNYPRNKENQMNLLLNYRRNEEKQIYSFLNYRWFNIAMHTVNVVIFFIYVTSSLYSIQHLYRESIVWESDY